ncbi:putative B3 domain-containing protein [Senna tora]|uniref:Putative B3 domain-containing protein n=1 Tax=Senna tora TaxID=362788 RepID=A0A834TT23_9FABA|nr:putative B3 domain-containing protein [Senna tora]
MLQKIPPLFNYRFGSVIPKKVTLKVASSNKSWRVDIEEGDDRELYFKKGWNTFVEDNGLEILEFVEFKYDGNSTFKVKMYEKYGCEKEVLEGTNQNNYFDADLENHQGRKRPIPQESHRERNPTGENRHKRKLDHEIKKEKEDSDDYGHINKRPAQKEADAEETSKVIINEAGNRIRKIGMHKKPLQRKAFDDGSKWDSKNPSFRVLLTQAYAEKGVLCMPTDFFKEHMENKKQRAEIETVNGSWSVTVLPHMKRTCTFARISAGWSDCVRGNEFKAGDILLFKLIHRSNSSCPKFLVRKLKN